MSTDVQVQGGAVIRRFFDVLCALLILVPTPSISAAWTDADYLVLVHSSLHNTAWMDKLVELKGRQDLAVAVQEVVDGQSAVELKARVAQAYGTGRVPRYLLLVGDSILNSSANAGSNCFVPTFTTPLPEFASGDFGAYDDQYALLVGSDSVPDLVVGRLPARSSGEVDQYVRKLEEYEGASELSWARTVLFLTHDVGAPTTGAFRNAFFRHHTEAIFQSFFAPHDFRVSFYGSLDRKARFLTYSHYSAMQDSESERWGALREELDSGCLIVNVFGLSSDISLGGFYDGGEHSVNELNLGGGRYPLIVAPTCNLGRLDGADRSGDGIHSSVARDFLFTAGKGAIALFGAHGGTHAGHNFWIAQEFYNQVLDQQVTTVGPAAMLAKMRVVERHPEAASSSKQYIFLGDPALILNRSSRLGDVAGVVAEDGTWAGYTLMTGDVTVPQGRTLEIGRYALVDSDGSTELGVHGTLIASGRSLSADVDVVVYSGGRLEMRGDLRVRGELVVEAGGRVVVQAGADDTGGGEDGARSELIVESGGRLLANEGSVTFGSTSATPSSDDWYGIRVASGGSADVSGATIRDASRCLESAVGATVTRRHTTLTNCGARVDYIGTPPQVGRTVTAVLAESVLGTVEGGAWQWEWRSSEMDPWEWVSSLGRYPVLSAYTPLLDDMNMNRMLRATVDYRVQDTNGQTWIRYAQSAPTAPVGPGPGDLRNCKPKSLDEAVKVTCSEVVDNGAEVTGCQQRYSAMAASIENEEWTDFTCGAHPNSDQSTRAPAVNLRVPGLTNGTEYTFELRALNAVGAGDSVRVAATPGSGPGVPPKPTAGLSATPEYGWNTVSWSKVSAKPKVTGYELQSQSAPVGTSTWSGYDSLTTTGAPKKPSYRHTSAEVTHRDRYQVRALNDSGAGMWSEAFLDSGVLPLPGEWPGLDSMRVAGATVQVFWRCPVTGWCQSQPGSTVAPLTLEARRRPGGGSWTAWEPVTTEPVVTEVRYPGLDRARVHEFTARAVNADRQGTDLTVHVGWALPLQAQAGDGQVTLSWEAPEQSYLSWKYRQKAGAGSWTAWRPVPNGQGSTRGFTVSGLTNGQSYDFQVQVIYVHQLGGQSFVASATPVAPLPPVRIVGPALPLFAENGTDTVATYRALDPQDQPVSVDWSVQGVDADTLEIDSSGRLWFETTADPPDFEAPGDRAGASEPGQDNDYVVSLRAVSTTPPYTASHDVTVRVTNMDEPGVVSLSSEQPTVGDQLTATLESDPDGGVVLPVTWSWHAWDGTTSSPRQARDSEGPETRGLADTYPYTVQPQDAGQRLVATFSYDDAHGPNKTARDTTDVVPGKPSVSFGASTYEATEGGSAATVTVEMSPAAGGPVNIPLEIEADPGTEPGDFSHSLGSPPGLSFAAGATSASFTVTANQDGDGADETVTVGFGTLPSQVVAGTPDETVVTLTDDDADRAGQVSLTPATTPQVGALLTASLTDPNGAVSDTSWQWQSRTTTTTPWSDLSNDTLSVYTPETADVGHQLRATVSYTDPLGPGRSAQSDATLPVVDPPPPGTITLSPDPPRTCAHLEATLEDADGGINTEFADSPQGFPYGWRWIPQTSSNSPSTTTTTNSYLPSNSLVGQRIRVTVQYGDNASDRNTATKTSGVVQANVPRTPTGVESTPGDGRVDLSWTAPNDCGSAIRSYAYRYRKASETVWLGSGTVTATSAAITGLDNDAEYRFEIKAVNAQGESAAATRDETPTPNPPGTVSFRNANPPQVDREVTATLSDDDNPRSITWAWERVPSAGAPTTRPDTDNTYTPVAADVGHGLRATATYTDDDGSGQTATATTSAVVNPPPPPTITLSPDPPKTCAHLEATLEDADGGINTEFADSPPGFPYGWRWIPQTSSNSPTTTTTTTTQSYLPANSLVGQTISVTVQYGGQCLGPEHGHQDFGGGAGQRPALHPRLHRDRRSGTGGSVLDGAERLRRQRDLHLQVPALGEPNVDNAHHHLDVGRDHPAGGRHVRVRAGGRQQRRHQCRGDGHRDGHTRQSPGHDHPVPRPAEDMRPSGGHSRGCGRRDQYRGCRLASGISLRLAVDSADLPQSGDDVHDPELSARQFVGGPDDQRDGAVRGQCLGPEHGHQDFGGGAGQRPALHPRLHGHRRSGTGGSVLDGAERLRRQRDLHLQVPALGEPNVDNAHHHLDVGRDHPAGGRHVRVRAGGRQQRRHQCHGDGHRDSHESPRHDHPFSRSAENMRSCRGHSRGCGRRDQYRGCRLASGISLRLAVDSADLPQSGDDVHDPELSARQFVGGPDDQRDGAVRGQCLGPEHGHQDFGGGAGQRPALHPRLHRDRRSGTGGSVLDGAERLRRQRDLHLQVPALGEPNVDNAHHHLDVGRDHPAGGRHVRVRAGGRQQRRHQCRGDGHRDGHTRQSASHGDGPGQPRLGPGRQPERRDLQCHRSQRHDRPMGPGRHGPWRLDPDPQRHECHSGLRRCARLRGRCHQLFRHGQGHRPPRRQRQLLRDHLHRQRGRAGHRHDLVEHTLCGRPDLGHAHRSGRRQPHGRHLVLGRRLRRVEPEVGLVLLHGAGRGLRPFPEGHGVGLHRRSRPRQERLGPVFGHGAGPPAGRAGRFHGHPGRRPGGARLGRRRRQRGGDSEIRVSPSFGHGLLSGFHLRGFGDGALQDDRQPDQRHPPSLRGPGPEHRRRQLRRRRLGHPGGPTGGARWILSRAVLGHECDSLLGCARRQRLGHRRLLLEQEGDLLLGFGQLGHDHFLRGRPVGEHRIPPVPGQRHERSRPGALGRVHRGRRGAVGQGPGGHGPGGSGGFDRLRRAIGPEPVQLDYDDLPGDPGGSGGDPDRLQPHRPDRGPPLREPSTRGRHARPRVERRRRPRPTRRLRTLPLPAPRRPRVPRRKTRPHPISRPGPGGGSVSK